MLHLQNQYLNVEILEPLADQQRFGVRYCTGGYIFQVSDTQHGALLTGPTYPASFNWFDGQGIPDAFNLSPLRQPGGSDSEVEIIGIGRCDLLTKQVVEFCEWDVAQDDKSISMTTRQQFASFDFQLERTVTLMERTIRSHTRISNLSEQESGAAIPMAWFPHPFYPQPDGNELCRLSTPVTMPENKGYLVAENGFICRKGAPVRGGIYQALDQQAHGPLTITQRHPTLGMVSASCSYVPTFFPIWGNEHTFSWEPFLERIIAQQQSFSWWIDYDF